MVTEQASDPAADAQLNELVNKAVALATKGDFSAAEPLFREVIRLRPHDPGFLNNLGLALAKLKRFDEAEGYLTEAVHRGGGPNSLITLGEVYEKQERYLDALKCFEALRALDFRKDEVLLKIGDLHLKAGDAAAAVKNYKLALDSRPGDRTVLNRLTEASLRAADGLWATDLDAAVRIEEDLLARVAGLPRARLNVLRQLVLHKEWSERVRHGKEPFHASHPEELFFHYARDLIEDLRTTCEEVVAAHPNDEDARISLGIFRFCLGDRRGAEEIIQSAPNSIRGNMYETIRFAPEFYDELRGFSDEDLERGLPPVLDVATMPGDPKGIVYLSCNFAYFVAFALPMLVSLRARSPATPVHLHVMDASPQQTTFVADFAKQLSPLTLAITVERPGLQMAPIMESRCYYHAVRFIRLHAHLKKYQSPLWLMDVDAIVNRDLGSLLERLPGHDVAVRIRPARLEPWNQFNACMVGANVTAASLEYFRLTAAYVAYFYQRKGLRWGIDQLAMYGVFADMQGRGSSPSLTLLGAQDVDYEHVDDGYVWPNSGIGKMKHLKRVSVPGTAAAGPPATKFDGVFERLWQETVQTAKKIGVKL